MAATGWACTSVTPTTSRVSGCSRYSPASWRSRCCSACWPPPGSAKGISRRGAGSRGAGSWAKLHEAGSWGMSLDLPRGTLEHALYQFDRKQPPRINRPRQRDLAGRDRRKAKPAVIGHVTHEQHEAEALRLRPHQPFAHQRLAVALTLDVGVDHERAEQRTAVRRADLDRGEAHAADQRAVEPAGKAQAGHRRHALAHPVRGAGKTARPKGLRGEFR